MTAEAEAAAAGSGGLDVRTMTAAGMDAHAGWYLYEQFRFHKSAHAKDWGDCEVDACRAYLKASGLAASDPQKGPDG